MKAILIWPSLEYGLRGGWNMFLEKRPNFCTYEGFVYHEKLIYTSNIRRSRFKWHIAIFTSVLTLAKLGQIKVFTGMNKPK